MKQRDVPGQWIEAPITELRERRQVAAIREALARCPQRSGHSAHSARTRRWVGGALAVVTLAGAGLFLLPVVSNPEEPQKMSAAGEPISDKHLTLRDGSQVTSTPGSEVLVTEASEARIELRVITGQARFEVSHRPERDFLVHAGNVRVKVIGTRFSVEREEATTVIAVVRGKVVVERNEDRWTLSAGESWRGRDDSSAGEQRAVIDLDGEAPPTLLNQEGVVEDTNDSGLSKQPSRASAGATTPEAPARALFQSAENAKIEGNPAKAAALYAELLQKYRSDSRAALAAFELGRLRQDFLGEPLAALSAFKASSALAPAAPWREHLEARRVRALHSLGRTAECRAVQRSYLEQYPQGAYRRSVESRCTD